MAMWLVAVCLPISYWVALWAAYVAGYEQAMYRLLLCAGIVCPVFLMMFALLFSPTPIFEAVMYPLFCVYYRFAGIDPPPPPAEEDAAFQHGLQEWANYWHAGGGLYEDDEEVSLEEDGGEESEEGGEESEEYDPFHVFPDYDGDGDDGGDGADDDGDDYEDNPDAQYLPTLLDILLAED